MVGKLIVHDKNRERAISRMERALEELLIEGIQTNKSQQQRIIGEPVYRSGNFGTSYYENIIAEAGHGR
jgi:acetyl-CoA carboxylase biotin carboxylase subunit